MRRMHATALFAALAATAGGCAGNAVDPDGRSPTLAAGSEFMFYMPNEGSSETVLMNNPSDPYGAPVLGGDRTPVFITQGCRGRVVRAYPKGSGGDADVLVLDGHHAGVRGFVRLSSLCPLPPR